MELLDTAKNSTSESMSEGNLIMYRFILPSFVVVGGIGNLINLIVLSSKEISFTARGHKISQRSKSMFSYMKALASTDLCYLIMTLQGCIFTLKGYYRLTDPVPMPTKGMGMYIWNYMSPFWNGFAASSDFIVVVMTIVRFQILRHVDTCGTIIAGSDTKPTWFIALAIFAGLLMHVPYNFQFEIVLSQPNEDLIKLDSWIAVQKSIADTVLWKFYGYIYQGVVKIIPTLIIFSLNLMMLIKMRSIFKRREDLRSSNNAGHRAFSDPRRPSNVLELPNIGTAESVNHSEITSQEMKSSESGSAPLAKRQRESLRQYKLNSLLLVLAFFHCLTTLPGNFSFIMWTVFPDAWADFSGRSTFATVSNVLYALNYSKNFYLYCFVHEDIRRVAKSKLTQLINRLK